MEASSVCVHTVPGESGFRFHFGLFVGRFNLHRFSIINYGIDFCILIHDKYCILNYKIKII